MPTEMVTEATALLDSENPKRSHSEDRDHPWETEHINLADGGFRAAVFGFNDGLVTNLCLVTGLHIASPGAPIFVTGIAGLLAGAVSMCIGEWLSMTAQAEGLEHELSVEKRHLTLYPQEEEHHMREILEEHGLSDNIINMVMQDLKTAPVEQKLNLHARLELGIDPDDLGSPLKAAVSSFVCFAVGAFIPLIPWIWLEGEAAFWLTILLAAVASIVVGGLFSKYSPRTALYNATRQLMISVAATVFCIVCNSYSSYLTGA